MEDRALLAISVFKGYWCLPQGEAMQINLEAIASIEGKWGLSLT